MNCNDCKYCSKQIISFLDENNIQTDIGTRVVKCLKQIEIIDENVDMDPMMGRNSTNQKFKGERGIIGIIKEFDTRKYSQYVKYNINKIETPQWCPLKK